MKNSELHNMWQNIEHDRQKKSKEELAGIVYSKTRKTVNRFLFVNTLSGAISVGVIVFLTFTALNRMNDTLYILNNALLGLITLFSLFSALWWWYKLNSRDYSKPIKEWLEKNIKIISASLHGKFKRLHILVIPVVYILFVLSINVYFSNNLFVQVVTSEESLIALIAGAIVGLSVSFYVERKIRNYHLRNLKKLEELYTKVIDIN